MHAPSLRWSLLLASVTAILVATLWPSAGPEPERLLTCVVCGDLVTADVLVNVLIFLPFGAALAAAGLPPRRCALAGALLSACVELAQLYVPGRDPSLGDVLFDTVGSGLGAALVTTAPYWLAPTGARAARLSRAAALAALALCYASGWLLTPALPPVPYFALWTPNVAHLEWYRGHVWDATVGDIRVPEGEIVRSAAVRERLLAPEGFALHVGATAGPRPAALGGLLGIYDGHGREVLLLGPDRDELVFRFRTRATAWRLDQPDIRFARALRSVAPGDTLDVTVQGRRGRHTVTANESRADGLGFTVGSGWALLMYPETLPAWFKTLFNFAWVAALWAPAGFWARTRLDAWIAVGALAAALLGVPALMPVRATPLMQWAGAGLGGLLGAALRLVLERYPPARPSTFASSRTQRAIRS